MKLHLPTILLVSLCYQLYGQTPGSLDLSFDPGAGTNALVESIAIQPDGQILIGGPFSSYDGTSINGIARLNTDGSLDTTFDPGSGVMGHVAGQQYHVYDIAIQNDGKIILAGAFHNFDNVSRDRIVRLNADGSIDLTFNPGNGADSEVKAIALQPDGKILLAGSFTRYYNLSTTPRLVRVNSDGTKDNTFTPGAGASSSINSLAIQADGKILIAGDFTTYDGTARNRVARVNSDGSLDTGFDPAAGSGGVFPSIRAVRIQNDGKVIVAGYFDSFDGTNKGRIARLNTNGSLDPSFDPGAGADLNAIHRVEILSSGKMIIVGSFYNFDGSSRNSIARIETDGSLDLVFDPGSGCNNTGEAMAIQSDGRILIGGNFGQYDGTARGHIARVHNDGTIGFSEEVAIQNKVSVYPNPTNGVFQVSSSNGLLQFNITDIKGVIIKDWSHSSTVDLSNYPKGVYFLQTASGQTIRICKL